MVIKYAEDTKQAGFASTLEDRIRMWNDLDKLEKWSGKIWCSL